MATAANELRGAVNGLFVNREPWQIVAITTTTVLSTVWLWNIINQDESIYSRLKKRVFKLARYIPAVQSKIDKEIAAIDQAFENDMSKFGDTLGYITVLPEKGLTREQIVGHVDNYLNLGNYAWKDGKVSGAVYYHDQDLIDLVTEVYGKSSYTNPLHPDIFPGICKMEAEVIRMLCTLFKGGPNSCGTMTTGGTESIMMAVKAYRDYAFEERGVNKPNIVMPVTAHTAFDKAAKYLKLFVKTVRVDEVNRKVDVRAMEKAINKNTVMLVGSAPNFPYGTMDDIVAIAALGRKYKIPVHVDACLGGFLVMFMKRAGYQVPPFNFSVDGVTSISADPHKYGFTPKGSSVILYSEKKFRQHQYTVTTDWPGGVYGSPTVNGSRAGGVIAATWAVLMNFGVDGYVETTKSIIDTSRYIESALRKMKGIFVYGTPVTSVIALGSKDFEIFRLSEALCAKGWNLNALQFPSGIHLCVTHVHTHPGVADQFIADVHEQLTELMKNPELPVEGRMAIYGVAQAVPDRSIVGDFTKCFLDSMYYTPPVQAHQ